MFSRSPEAAFDESQGRELQAIAERVRAAVEARAVPLAEREPPAPRSPHHTALLAVAGAACVVAPLMMITGIHSALRVAAAIALLTLAPGAAALPLFASWSEKVELGLVVGTSLGISGLLAELMLSLGAWSPAGGTAVVATVCLVSILAQLGVRRSRAQPEWGRP